MHSVISVCLSVCVYASILLGLLTFERLAYKLEYTCTSSEHPGQGQVSRSWDQGQDCVRVTTLTAGLPLTEKQLCLHIDQ